MHTITPVQARQSFNVETEFAFLDLRELVPFGMGHAFLAANLPWSRLESSVTALVPRRSTRIVLCDQAGELSPLASHRLALLGYDDVSVLEGGADAWAAAGMALFSEIEVPAKGFGAFARILGKPNYISPKELRKALESDDDWIVLDTRPMREYRLGNIPGSIDTPGPDVFRCFDDLVPDPATKVVVNCMSATRGTLGGLSLLAGDVPNPVYVLHHGTRGWLLDGLKLEKGASRVPDPPSARAVTSARARAKRIRDRAGIEMLDAAGLARWQADPTRTTYLFDVRSPREYEARHIAGSRNAPEGRIVLSPEDFFATRNARIVLCDDDTSRATITALWLGQMGWGQVAVTDGRLENYPLETGPEPDAASNALDTLSRHLPVEALTPEALKACMDSGTIHLVDVGASASFLTQHVPGAVWYSREQAQQYLETAAGDATVVFTCETGQAAQLAAMDRLPTGDSRVAWLRGGNAAWRQTGYTVEQGDAGLLGDRVDAWLAASERPGDVTENVVAYLDWETQLMEQITAAGEAPYKNLIWPAA